MIPSFFLSIEAAVERDITLLSGCSCRMWLYILCNCVLFLNIICIKIYYAVTIYLNMLKKCRNAVLGDLGKGTSQNIARSYSTSGFFLTVFYFTDQFAIFNSNHKNGGHAFLIRLDFLFFFVIMKRVPIFANFKKPMYQAFI